MVLELNKNIEENIKNSFFRVKQHINLIENEVKSNRNFIIEQNRQIQEILSKIKSIYEELDKIKSDLYVKCKNQPNVALKDSSTGNKGVYSFIHSTDIHSFNKQSLNSVQESDFSGFKKKIKLRFRNLSRQEFLVFLTIYEICEKQKYATYSQIASKLKLSEGCIRTYISSLIRKNMPVVKEKYNNRNILLSINPHFKEIGFKNELEELFYEIDPAQKKLVDLQ